MRCAAERSFSTPPLRTCLQAGLPPRLDPGHLGCLSISPCRPGIRGHRMHRSVGRGATVGPGRAQTGGGTEEGIGIGKAIGLELVDERQGGTNSVEAAGSLRWSSGDHLEGAGPQCFGLVDVGRTSSWRVVEAGPTSWRGRHPPRSTDWSANLPLGEDPTHLIGRGSRRPCPAARSRRPASLIDWRETRGFEQKPGPRENAVHDLHRAERRGIVKVGARRW